MLPFALVARGKDDVPVLLGQDAEGLVGLDVVEGRLVRVEAEDVGAVVSAEPAAVYYGVELASAQAERLAAEQTSPYSSRAQPLAVTRQAPPPEQSLVSGELEDFVVSFMGNVGLHEDDYGRTNLEAKRAILRALRSVDVTDIDEVLGGGSFGLAAAIDDRRVIKLTSDPTEIKASTVLARQRIKGALPHVVEVERAAYIRGVEATSPITYEPTRIGLVIMERLGRPDEHGASDEALSALGESVREVKEELDLWPDKMLSLPPRVAREQMKKASRVLEATILERYDSLGDEPENHVLSDVSEALSELRSVGIYAIDAHQGNIGYDYNTGRFKLFDIGASSPPPGVRPPERPPAARRRKPSAPPAIPLSPQLTLPGVTEDDIAVEEVGGEETHVAEAPRSRGMAFVPLLDTSPFGIPVTGYSEVRGMLLKHRAELPSLETIRLTTIFAGLTVMVGIEQAEAAFACLAALRSSGQLPGLEEAWRCIEPLGLRAQRKALYEAAQPWAIVCQDAIKGGLKDRALRKHLFLKSELPTGISLAKLSFILALLGHDTVCLDARLLGRMFGSVEKARAAAGAWNKVSELSLRRYETTEDAFLARNPFYRPNDPIGRARAQWMSWESVGGAPAAHRVWLSVVR